MTINNRYPDREYPVSHNPGSHSVTSTNHPTFHPISFRLRSFFVGATIFSAGCDQYQTDSQPAPLFAGIDFNEMRDGKYLDTGLEFVNEPYFDIRTAQSKAIMKIGRYKAIPGRRLQALAEYREAGRDIDPSADGYVRQSEDFTEWCRQHNYDDVALNEEHQLNIQLSLRAMAENRKKEK